MVIRHYSNLIGNLFDDFSSLFNHYSILIQNLFEDYSWLFETYLKIIRYYSNLIAELFVIIRSLFENYSSLLHTYLRTIRDYLKSNKANNENNSVPCYPLHWSTTHVDGIFDCAVASQFSSCFSFNYCRFGDWFPPPTLIPSACCNVVWCSIEGLGRGRKHRICAVSLQNGYNQSHNWTSVEIRTITFRLSISYMNDHCSSSSLAVTTTFLVATFGTASGFLLPCGYAFSRYRTQPERSWLR